MSDDLKQIELDALQKARLAILQQALGNYDRFKYVDLNQFLDPDNPYWYNYTRRPSVLTGTIPGRVSLASPIGKFIQQLRDAKTIDDVRKQQDLWNFYNPLSSYGSGRDYVNYFIKGEYKGSNAPYGGSRPLFPTTNESDPVQTTAGGTQDVQATTGGAQDVKTTAGGTQGTQGTQAGAQAGNAAAKGSIQGTNNGSGGTQGTNNNGGTYTLGEVAKGGTKTIGYDPNPGNVSLAYAMRNAPEQERRAALIDEWNREHGISYATGKDGLIYRIDPQHPNGYVDPFKNDLSKTGSTGYGRSSSTYASPGISTGGTYATGQGIKDANGNVLTNPGGDWEYQYALKNPQYGLGMMGKMSDAQREYLQAVSDDMGYKYNFKGATRFV